MEGLKDMKLHIFFFHPNILNNKFEFSYIRQASRENVTNPLVQDLYLFNPFLIRDGSLSNQYRLTSVMLRKFLQPQPV
ncbi:MAG TPA: hypothetical protein VJ888_02415 [Mobilitalea sp.]|nr:hypothetical protein [Mobilitalea sp.]